MGGWIDRLIDVKPTTPWVKIFKRLVQVYLIYLDIWTTIDTPAAQPFCTCP